MPPSPHTLFTGRNVMWLPEVDSTNTYCAQPSRLEKFPEGTVVAALEQSAGKGQRGNHWQSVAGESLTFSVILRPSFLLPDRQFLLNMIFSLSVSKLAEELTGLNAAVKWPNDVMIEGRKCAGILIENFVAQGRIRATVAGVGINLNQSEFKGLPHATSFKMKTGQQYDLKEVLSRFCEILEPLYLRLRAGNHSFERTYHERLFSLGEKKKFLMEGHELYATIRGVDSQGRLCLDTGREVICCGMQEVSYVL